jgi:hypothetical protein
MANRQVRGDFNDDTCVNTTRTGATLAIQECLDLSTEPTLGNSLACGDAISQTWPAAVLCAKRSVQWR